jgi:uncharacterized protein (TIGR03000 family)
MRPLRAALPFALAAAPAAAGDHEPYGSVRNVVDPPGWLGPGPNTHKWREPGPGTGWSYYGLGAGPGAGPYTTIPFSPVGFFPPAVGSFWTNGYSLYGPPVPTYNPVPGTFGMATADKLHFRHTDPRPVNAAFPGLGWYGYRNPSPRPVHPSVNVWPAVPGPFPMPLGEMLPPASDPTCIRVAMRLPAPDAEVWVNETATKQMGAQRVFQSPPLKEGGRYKYDVVARWKENGQDRAESRTVTAAAGEAVAVDFTQPAEAVAAAKP